MRKEYIIIFSFIFSIFILQNSSETPQKKQKIKQEMLQHKKHLKLIKILSSSIVSSIIIFSPCVYTFFTKDDISDDIFNFYNFFNMKLLTTIQDEFNTFALMLGIACLVASLYALYQLYKINTLNQENSNEHETIEDDVYIEAITNHPYFKETIDTIQKIIPF